MWFSRSLVFITGLAALSMLVGCASTIEDARQAAEAGNSREAAKIYREIAAQPYAEGSDEASWKYGLMLYHGRGVATDLDAAVEHLMDGFDYFEANTSSFSSDPRFRDKEDQIYEAMEYAYKSNSGESAWGLASHYHPRIHPGQEADPWRLKVTRYWAQKGSVSIGDSVGSIEQSIPVPERLIEAIDALKGANGEVSEEAIDDFLAVTEERRKLDYGCAPSNITVYWTWQAARHGHLVSQYRMHQIYTDVYYDEYHPDIELMKCWHEQDDRLGRKWLVRAANNGHRKAMEEVASLEGPVGEQRGVPEPDLPEQAACYVAGDRSRVMTQSGEVRPMSTERSYRRARWLALREAAKTNDVPRARCMLRKGADVNELNQSGVGQLHLAADSGSVAVAKVLLEHGVDVDAQDEQGESPLYRAVAKGDVEMVDLLTEKGASVTLSDNDGKTPLHLAAQQGHRRIIQLLADKAGTLTPRDADDETPLHKAARSGHVKVVKELLSLGVEVNAQGLEGTPLHLANDFGNEEVAQLLEGSGGRSLGCQVAVERLFRAARNGQPREARCQAKNGADVTATDGDGATPLHVAAANNASGVVDVLLNHSAEIDVQDDSGATPLHVAARSNSAGAARSLANHGGDSYALGGLNQTPVELAVDSGSFEAAEVLVEARERDVAASNSGTSGPSTRIVRSEQVRFKEQSTTHGYMQKLVNTLETQARLEKRCDVDPDRTAPARLLAYIKELEARYEYRWTETVNKYVGCGFGDLACGLSPGYGDHEYVNKERRRPLKEVYIPGNPDESAGCDDYRALQKDSRRQIELLRRHAEE